MIPMRVCILRALYQWICAGGWTPHLIADPHYPGVQIRSDLITRGQMVFNIADRAVDDLNLMTMHRVLRFTAFIEGRPVPVALPIGACIGLYAKETGLGLMQFPDEPDLDGPDEPEKQGLVGMTPGNITAFRRQKPTSHLTVVQPPDDPDRDIP